MSTSLDMRPSAPAQMAGVNAGRVVAGMECAVSRGGRASTAVENKRYVRERLLLTLKGGSAGEERLLDATFSETLLEAVPEPLQRLTVSGSLGHKRVTVPLPSVVVSGAHPTGIVPVGASFDRAESCHTVYYRGSEFL